MKVLIVDDAQVWIDQGRKLLEAAGHEVDSHLVTDPSVLIGAEMPAILHEKIAQTELVISDKDIGDGITSTRLLCVIRRDFPNTPLIRWTSGYERSETDYMRLLGVSVLSKPTKKSEDDFIEDFDKAVERQRMILGGPMVIFENLEEVVQEPDVYAAKSRANRLKQLRQIAGLAEADRVASDNWEYPWTITGRSGGVTKHELGHAICDGDLDADDIRPHLSALQKVIAKFRAANEIDDRFATCAAFIEEGNLDELELVRRCY